ncbi:uncharacterized protein LOC109595997 [Aethina tumida]|uniref:uncharacterized protein LOC109595997 n=1 Tax=Aethina tumida TaxID=116153 RepID=UPI0021494200|nr:uncharacterized protein LOC109595997 [Aethina tumida]
MKYLIVFVCALVAVQGRQLPEYLREFACTRYDPEFEKCVFRGFESARPYFMKGIPELGLPPMDPFELPVMTVDRTINDLVSIKAVLRNVKMTGARNTVIDYLKADAINGTGEIRLSIPYCDLEMEYDVSGQLLSIPLHSKGYFQGNFTDTQLYVKGSVRRYQKDGKGEEYFRVGKLNTKITVGDGHIKLVAKNPELQFGADLIANFYNENPRRVMDAVNPIFVESSNELFRVVMDQILATLPASEWVPEK